MKLNRIIIKYRIILNINEFLLFIWIEKFFHSVTLYVPRNLKVTIDRKN